MEKILFFRNTHEAPDFKKFRPAAAAAEQNLRYQGENPGFIIHLLHHEKGMTLEQVQESAHDYEEQFDEEFSSLEDILAALSLGIKHNLIRVNTVNREEEISAGEWVRGGA